MKSIRRLGRKILRTIGYDLIRISRRTPPVYGLDPFFTVLVRHGFSPRHIIDVGANRGDWTRHAIKYFPGAHYTMFEPQKHLRSCVDDLIKQGHDIDWVNAGVADKCGKFRFAIASMDFSSAFVGAQSLGTEENRPGEVTMDVRTLDEVVATKSLLVPEMVKIDAEGFDLKVLDGAKTLLGKTDVVLAEGLLAAGGYENTMLKLIEKMDRAGYSLFDITEFIRYPENGALWACEFAFLRRDGDLYMAIFSKADRKGS